MLTETVELAAAEPHPLPELVQSDDVDQAELDIYFIFFEWYKQFKGGETYLRWCQKSAL